MRNTEFEQLVSEFLISFGQNEISSLKEFNIECYEPGGWGLASYDYGSEKGIAQAATIATKTGNLRQLRDLIEDLINAGAANIDDFICVNMMDYCQSRRQWEADWVLTIHIKTEIGLDIFKKSLKEAIEYHYKQLKRDVNIEHTLSVIYNGFCNKTIEFLLPYEGKKGKYPAEVFCKDGDIDEIANLFKELKFEQDIFIDDFGMKRGITQIIIKTKEALNAFKKSINEKSTQFKLRQAIEKSQTAYVKGATAGALNEKLPTEISFHVGLFLGRREGGRLAQTCKLATKIATEERAKMKRTL